MAHLIYYSNEKEVFKTAFEKKMSQVRAVIVFEKLCRHFKLGQPYLVWTSGRNHPRASNCPRKVTLNVDCNSFGILCHELAHIKQMVKGNKGHTWHNKKHMRFMKSMIAYCEKKNYFETELERRLAPKPVKPEPTKDELKAKMIARLENNCRRYQTKIQLYNNKLRKTQKKILRLKKIVMGNLPTPEKLWA